MLGGTRFCVITLFLGLVLACPVMAQVDSLRAILNKATSPQVVLDANLEIAVKYRERFPDSAFVYCDRALLIADSLKLEDKQALIHAEKALLHKNNGDIGEAHKEIIAALEGVDKLASGLDKAHVYLVAGHVYAVQQEHDKAVDYYERSLELYSQLNDASGIAYVQSGLGIVRYDQGDVEEAGRYYRLALSNLGEVDMEHRADIYNNLAVIFVDQGMVDSALEYYYEALDVYLRSQRYMDQSMVYYNIGEMYMETDQFEAALSNFENSLRIAEDIESATDVMWAYEGLARTYEHFDYPAEALQYTKRYYVLKDSLTDAQHLQDIRMTEAEFMARKSEAELQRTNQELEQASSINTGLWASVTALLVILVLGVYIFRLNRYSNRMLRMQQQQVISTNGELRKALQEKEVLLKEIHHRVKNNLQIISSLLNLQSHKVSDEEALDVLAEGRERIRAIALIHQKLYQNKNLAEVDFEAYIRDLVGHQQLAYQGGQDKVKYKIETGKVSLNLDTAVPVGLILNELISNANKHAFKNQADKWITIGLHPVNGEKHHFLLQVSDNGVGLPADFQPEESDSLGLEIVKSLTEQLEGQFEMSGEDGTVVQVRFNEVDPQV